MRAALVTGATGFVGSHLLRRLRAEGANAWGVSRSGSSSDAQVLTADIGHAPSCRRVIARVDPGTVFHLAGRRGGSEEEMRAVQVDGTLSLLEALCAHGAPCRVVVVGSAAEYGAIPEQLQPIEESTACRPASPYARTKHAAVLAALAFGREHGLPIVVARPFNIVGPGMPPGLVVSDLIQRLLAHRHERSPVIHTGRLVTRRDFIDVDDVVRALRLMATGGRAGEIYNVCSGIPTPIADVVAELIRLSGTSATMVEDPALQRPGDVAVAYGSTDKAMRELGYVARITLESSLERTWAYFSGKYAT